jgi:glyoxylase-like metal-dependent hydrolase (beta-lactamase superfamily II)
MWLIEGPKEKILVDTGCDALTASRLGFTAEQVALPKDALAKNGLGFEDIDVLILTHMHFDHLEFARQFIHSRVLIQRAEYDFAMNPHPFFAKGFIKDLFPDPGCIDLVEGDAKVAEGVSVFLTPGHTPGGQSVAITTDRGTIVICGLCSVQDNLYPPKEAAAIFPVIPPGIHTDVMKAYDSLSLIKSRADLAVPLHDPSFSLRERIP